MDWKTVHFDGLEGEFFDQDGIGELTIPAGHRVIWDRSLSRPEMDRKRHPQPEVWDGDQSACGFLPFKKFRWWCYTEVPIAVASGVRTRADVWFMIVSHGIDGDNGRAGACGMRLGISAADVYDPLSEDIVWSKWWVVRDTLDNERLWEQMSTPEYVPDVGEVRLWVQCNADVAAAISAGHWDNERILQYGDKLPDGLDETRVRELIAEAFPAHYAMHEKKTITKLLEAIRGGFPV